MEHLAILAKKGHFIKKISSGTKTIESRWYKHRKAPFEAISAGDTVYFKESGESVSVKATVERVLFYRELTPEKIKEIITEYGTRIGVAESYATEIKDKKLCTLIFLTKVEKIKPFDIDKKGYGMMNAWITVDAITMLKKSSL